MKIGIKLLSDRAKVPTYADPGSSGFDLYATEEKILLPGMSAGVGTGIALEIPEGYEVQIRGRSGLAFKNGVVSHFGTIDSSYKGEIRGLLFNHGEDPLFIKIGDRIAQGIIAPVLRAEFDQEIELTESERGDGGFGHSGR